jgi:hypothetical protein
VMVLLKSASTRAAGDGIAVNDGKTGGKGKMMAGGGKWLR